MSLEEEENRRQGKGTGKTEDKPMGRGASEEINPTDTLILDS